MNLKNLQKLQALQNVLRMITTQTPHSFNVKRSAEISNAKNNFVSAVQFCLQRKSKVKVKPKGPRYATKSLSKLIYAKKSCLNRRELNDIVGRCSKKLSDLISVKEGLNLGLWNRLLKIGTTKRISTNKLENSLLFPGSRINFLPLQSHQLRFKSSHAFAKSEKEEEDFKNSSLEQINCVELTPKLENLKEGKQNSQLIVKQKSELIPFNSSQLNRNEILKVPKLQSKDEVRSQIIIKSSEETPKIDAEQEDKKVANKFDEVLHNKVATKEEKPLGPSPLVQKSANYLNLSDIIFNNNKQKPTQLKLEEFSTSLSKFPKRIKPIVQTDKKEIQLSPKTYDQKPEDGGNIDISRSFLKSESQKLVELRNQKNIENKWISKPSSPRKLHQQNAIQNFGKRSYSKIAKNNSNGTSLVMKKCVKFCTRNNYIYSIWSKSPDYKTKTTTDCNVIRKKCDSKVTEKVPGNPQRPVCSSKFPICCCCSTSSPYKDISKDIPSPKPLQLPQLISEKGKECCSISSPYKDVSKDIPSPKPPELPQFILEKKKGSTSKSSSGKISLKSYKSTMSMSVPQDNDLKRFGLTPINKHRCVGSLPTPVQKFSKSTTSLVTQDLKEEQCERSFFAMDFFIPKKLRKNASIPILDVRGKVSGGEGHHSVREKPPNILKNLMDYGLTPSRKNRSSEKKKTNKMLLSLDPFFFGRRTSSSETLNSSKALELLSETVIPTKGMSKSSKELSNMDAITEKISVKNNLFKQKTNKLDQLFKSKKKVITESVERRPITLKALDNESNEAKLGGTYSPSLSSASCRSSNASPLNSLNVNICLSRSLSSITYTNSFMKTLKLKVQDYVRNVGILHNNREKSLGSNVSLEGRCERPSLTVIHWRRHYGTNPKGPNKKNKCCEKEIKPPKPPETAQKVQNETCTVEQPYKVTGKKPDCRICEIIQYNMPEMKHEEWKPVRFQVLSKKNMWGHKKNLRFKTNRINVSNCAKGEESKEK